MTTRNAVAEVNTREEAQARVEEATTNKTTGKTVRETLADIFADSQQAPRQYIDETVSPLGGE